jgi:hypothetical protein
MHGSGGTITLFSAGLNSGSVPDGITSGADGNLWFLDKGTIKATGSITTSGTIAEYGVTASGGNADSAPQKIAAGPDGNVWFNDNGTTQAIGRFGVGAPSPSVTPPTITGTGGVALRQSCGGDAWSSWAGEQPSYTAYGFDGYQWLLDASPIAGATRTSYTPTVADAGHLLSCSATVTYTLFPVTVSATSAGVEVKGAAEQLAELAAAVAGVGPGQSLAGKVTAIQRYATANDTADACAMLGAFINELDAQTGKKISTTDSASLVTQSQDIEAALGC